jgi:hypothetical protein
MTMRTYSGGGGSLQMYVPYGPSNGGTGLQVRFGNYDVSSGNSWTSWKTLLASDNYNSYAPTLTGGGASGTWAINITGSAGSAPGYLPLSGGTMTGTIAGGSGVSSLFTGNSGGALRGYLYNDASGFGLLTFAGGWAVRVDYGTTSVYIPGIGYSDASFRAPIFYDSNDTNYYVDPNSNSRLVNLGLGGVTPDVRLSVSGDAHISSYLYMGGTAGAVGSWSSRLLSSGGATTLNTSTFTVDRTGYGGGSFSMDTAGNSYASASFRAPIFYDNDDTAFYTDPNSISSQKTVMVGYTAGLVYNVSSSGYLTFGSTSDPTNYSILTEIQDYNGNYSKLRLKWYTGIQYYAANIYGGHRFYDILGTEYFGIGVGSGANHSYSVYSHRAPIFYDLDNTGYYLDLNGSSNASTNLYGAWYFTSNFNTGSGSSAPLQAYSSGGSGAVMSFHRGGYYAVNMGLDSDNVFRIGGWSAAANLFQMDMSGNLTMAANVTAYSDETLKKDWDDLPSDFVPRLARVKSGTYTRIDNEMRQIGVGAQSLRPLMEEAVFENADGTLSVAYGNAAMASSVELARYVTALEQRISQLEARA